MEEMYNKNIKVRNWRNELRLIVFKVHYELLKRKRIGKHNPHLTPTLLGKYYGSLLISIMFLQLLSGIFQKNVQKSLPVSEDLLLGASRMERRCPRRSRRDNRHVQNNSSSLRLRQLHHILYSILRYSLIIKII